MKIYGHIKTIEKSFITEKLILILIYRLIKLT